MKIKLLEP